MKRLRSIIFCAIVGVQVISCAGMNPPQLSDVEYHRAATSRESCLSCHLKGAEGIPKSPHPQRQKCISCHIIAKS